MDLSRVWACNRHQRMLSALFAVLAASGPVAAQNMDQLAASGGQIHLQSSIQLNHTLVLQTNAQLTCDPGVSISDVPSMKLNSIVQVKGQGISIRACKIFSNITPVIVNFAANSSNILINGNQFSSFVHAHGIVIDAPNIHGVNVTANTFDNVGYGVLQNVHSFDMTNLVIDGNTFTNVYADAIEINDPVTVNCCGMQLTDVRASAIKITNNNFSVPKHAGSNSSAGFCVGVAGAYNVEISKNTCVAWSEGVHIEDRAYNITVTDNTITTNDQTKKGEQSAIWIVDGSHIVIARNIIQNAANDGIHLTYDVKHQASDVDISGNTITGCGGNGLFIAGGSLGPMNTRIHENTVSGCATQVVLSGKLQSLTFHSNHIDAANGCVFTIPKTTNKDDIDVKDNKDPNSGADANAKCAS